MSFDESQSPLTRPRGTEAFLTALARGGSRLGMLLIAAGLIAIGLGYNGAAGFIALSAQLPYLLSGGFFGLALVVAGSALLVTQGAREDSARVEAYLAKLVEAQVTSQETPEVPSDLTGLVVAGTASYHLPGCRLVDGREQVDYLTPTEARSEGLNACRICSPDEAAATSNVRVR